MQGKDPRCGPNCQLDPLNPSCPPNCKKFRGKDPRCAPNCSLEPLDPLCPPDCTARPDNPRCPLDCTTRPDDPRCPLDCTANPADPRCPQDPCLEDPSVPDCEGVELFGEPGLLQRTSTTSTAAPPPPTSPATTLRTSTRPGLKPTKPSPSPRAGRQNEEPQPEPEPLGDPRYHAFHSYHYSAGDGRRQRGAAAAVRSRLGRSIDFEEDTSPEQDRASQLVSSFRQRRRNASRSGRSHVVAGREASSTPASGKSSGSARLARHIRVISPDDLPEFATGTLDFESQLGEDRRICLSTESFLSGLVLLVVVLIIVMAVLAVYCIRDRKEADCV